MFGIRKRIRKLIITGVLVTFTGVGFNAIKEYQNIQKMATKNIINNDSMVLNSVNSVKNIILKKNSKIVGDNKDNDNDNNNNNQSTEYLVEINNNGEYENISFIADNIGDKTSVIVNNNLPFFKENLLKINESFENYSDLDDKGRTRSAIALLSFNRMPYKIQMVKGKEKLIKIKRVARLSTTPSGWKQADYQFVDGGHLYNRSHLIGYQLASENDNLKNLITGTRQLNVEGMLPYENLVADYINKTKEKDKNGKVSFKSNHVLYRVSPIYKDNELVPRGVLMEGKSIEDNQVQFCVFVPNTQKNVNINYSTGDSVENLPSN